MKDRLNLTFKESWSGENAREIALILGFVYNDAFLEILEDFIENTVAGATTTSFLASIAIGVFRNSGQDSVS